MSGVSAISPAASVQPALPNRGAASTAPAPSGVSQLGLSGPPPVNPGLHLDPALNIVVLQFFNSKGDVTQTIPSPKQIKAYQQEASAPHAPPPSSSEKGAPNATGNV